VYYGFTLGVIVDVWRRELGNRDKMKLHDERIG